MGRVISIANQKGGVGKTTTTVNLSASLAKIGFKVLVVDIDPQGNATSGLGIDKYGLEANLYDVFAGVFNLSSVIVGTELPSLWVAPANMDLVGAELELANREGRELVLKRELGKLREQFDFILIDCPPSLGMLTLNALVASDGILVPLQCEYYALEGISALMQSVELAKKQLNQKLELEGVVLTMYDSRTNLSRQVGDEARQFFASKVFKTLIPRNIKLSESPSFGKPVLLYDPQSIGAVSYQSLAQELVLRLKTAGKLPSKAERTRNERLLEKQAREQKVAANS